MTHIYNTINLPAYVLSQQSIKQNPKIFHTVIHIILPFKYTKIECVVMLTKIIELQSFRNVLIILMTHLNTSKCPQYLF